MVRKSFKEACRRSGVGDGYRIHDLRRSLATWMLNGGESLTVVAEMLGDTEEVACKHYAHLLPEKVSEATENNLDVSWLKTLNSKVKSSGNKKAGDFSPALFILFLVQKVQATT